MPTKKIKPTTPSRRFLIPEDFTPITKTTPEKALLLPLKKRGGRNNTGKMTMRYRGGGHKQRQRIIDFKRQKYDVPATIQSIEYDPNRTAYIALIYYKDGEKTYIIAPKNIAIGTQIVSGENVAPEIGNAMPLKSIPIGTPIHNIELNPGKGAAMARSAGTYAQLAARDGKYTTLKLPSGEMRLVLSTCMATIGTVSNSYHAHISLGKAGCKRRRGRRPHTSGKAMNPVDHPKGGGEGHSSGGHPRSRKGLYAKGKVTRKRKKYSNRFIIKKKK